MIVAVVALLIVLVGCQHAMKSDIQKPSTSWRVLERVGDVLMVRGDGAIDIPLLPGDKVAAGRRVTSGTGALLILSRDGVQLTAGENTSLRLSDPAAPPGLLLDRGWLRVRISAAANRSARIKTPHFDINASNGTLTLRTAADQASLSVDAGSAVLATSDGRHRATLVAGAKARIDQASGEGLFVQQASDQIFTKVSPLTDDTSHAAEGDSSRAPIGKAGARSGALEDDLSVSARDRAIAIRPASRRTPDRPASPRVPQPIETTDVLSTFPNAVPMSATSPSSLAPSTRPDVMRSSMPTGGIDRDQGDPAAYPTMNDDPVQRDFQRLTDGLLDGL